MNNLVRISKDNDVAVIIREERSDARYRNYCSARA